MVEVGGGEVDAGCPPGEVVVTPEGLRVCTSDGRVLGSVSFDDSPEWRKFPSKGESKGLERGSRPLTYSLHNGGVGAEIRVVRGAGITRSSMRLRNMKRGVYRVSASRKERTLIEMFTLMHRILDYLDLPKSSVVSEVAGRIIKGYIEERREEGSRANKATIINSREKLAVVIAAIRKALIIHNLPIGESELYEAAANEAPEAKSPDFANYVWRIMKRMSDYGVVPRSQELAHPNARARLMRIERYIVRLLDALELPITLRTPALRFLETSMRSGKSLWGRKPEAVAAAVVYLVARLYGYEDITQKTVASVYKLSEANVRKTFRHLLEDTVVVVGV